MNAQYHSLVSAKRRGGKPEDYYELHDFSDISKEIVSDQRFRIYGHNIWSIKNYIIPIFGHTITNSDGKNVNVKDMLESDHIACDFNGYIPNLIDYVDLINDSVDTSLVKEFHKKYSEIISKYSLDRLLYSPLSIAGKVKSLLITHNDWFWNTVVSRITKIKIDVDDHLFPVSFLFDNMKYENWLSGKTPNSKYKKLLKKGQNEQ
jgi:hypothetical protein